MSEWHYLVGGVEIPPFMCCLEDAYLEAKGNPGDRYENELGLSLRGWQVVAMVEMLRSWRCSSCGRATPSYKLDVDIKK